MQLGMVGLGRMGSGMTKRLEQHGHELKTYDPNVGSTAKTLRALAKQLDAPRHIWLMVPSGKVTEDTFQKLLDIVEPGDTIVDGGNSNFRDSKRRYAEARKRKVAFVDVGVSGGIWGLEVGFCLMAGGDKAPVKRLQPVFEALAPENGWAHVGASGARASKIGSSRCTGSSSPPTIRQKPSSSPQIPPETPTSTNETFRLRASL